MLPSRSGILETVAFKDNVSDFVHWISCFPWIFHHSTILFSLGLYKIREEKLLLFGKMENFSRITVLVLILCCLALTEGSEYLKYKDPKQPLNVRINDLLSRMTLAEKIGQMSQIERENATAEVIKKYFIGLLVLVSINCIQIKKCTIRGNVNSCC